MQHAAAYIVKQHTDVGKVQLIDAAIHLKIVVSVVGSVYLMVGLLLDMIQ